MLHNFTVVDTGGTPKLLDNCVLCGTHRHEVEASDEQCPNAYPCRACGRHYATIAEAVECCAEAEPAEATTLSEAIRQVRDAQLHLLRLRNAELRDEVAKMQRVIDTQREELRLLRYSVTKYLGAQHSGRGHEVAGPSAA